MTQGNAKDLNEENLLAGLEAMEKEAAEKGISLLATEFLGHPIIRHPDSR